MKGTLVRIVFVTNCGGLRIRCLACGKPLKAWKNQNTSRQGVKDQTVAERKSFLFLATFVYFEALRETGPFPTDCLTPSPPLPK
jgi:hypothetical protein